MSTYNHAHIQHSYLSTKSDLRILKLDDAMPSLLDETRNDLYWNWRNEQNPDTCYYGDRDNLMLRALQRILLFNRSTLLTTLLTTVSSVGETVVEIIYEKNNSSKYDAQVFQGELFLTLSPAQPHPPKIEKAYKPWNQSHISIAFQSWFYCTNSA